MLLLQGSKPFSEFRLQKITSDIQKIHPRISSVTAHYFYFVCGDSLNPKEHVKLIEIVDPLSRAWEDTNSSQKLWVTPRFGTISSWSSKATDILQVCGLSKISRIERGILYELETTLSDQELLSIKDILHDKMTETVSTELAKLSILFEAKPAQSLPNIDILASGLDALIAANQDYGLALAQTEMTYLYESYQRLQRNPTIAELMMFGQVNSEHCRHKIFNAKWTIDEKEERHTLFSMIRNTYEISNVGVISAYKDNGAIIAGHEASHFFCDPHTKVYQDYPEVSHIVIKVETHNHPTAISPFAGAATGSGGEIRDEGATGIGAKPKAGLTGFSVSNLHIPGLEQPWEQVIGYPDHIASSLNIMLEGPIGAASFNNEFGRPNLCGYFRTFEMLTSQNTDSVKAYGYHKPIMIAGGMGQIRPQATRKSSLPHKAKLIVLGGPAMLIGLGGGAASSVASGSSKTELDFASVQRSNPEMQRRCQEVINTCWALGNNNPIISIHDVGAGGLSNALSEIVNDSEKGGYFHLRAIPTAESGLNAMELWCNEAQERYVLAIREEDVALFQEIANRERCPFAILGEANDSRSLELYDEHFNEFPVNVPLNMLFEGVSKVHKKVARASAALQNQLDIKKPLHELVSLVLQLPAVADKSFLITIGDRSVTGLVARDQMVGPWQVPVADVAVTATSFNHYTGEAMAMGERTPLALLNAPASARMAIAEAITNILAADIKNLSDIKLSANWMAAANQEQEDYKLFETVKAVGMELCPALGICIPVGKDSLSMRMKWQKENTAYEVSSPLSLIISAFAPVTDVRRTFTPELSYDKGSELILIDLGSGKNRLGGSALAQVLKQIGTEPPDLDHPVLLLRLFRAINKLRNQNLISAYHDRSDGGLIATLCEMSFASHLGITIEIAELGEEPLASLFAEELGVVIQCSLAQRKQVFEVLRSENLDDKAFVIGKINATNEIIINHQGKPIYKNSRVALHRLWSETSYRMQRLRDNPICAKQEYDRLLDNQDPGLHAELTFAIPAAHNIAVGAKPKVAILREQGVNGQIEMAAAFDRAGFSAIDVHMTDVIAGRVKLNSFQGLVACGGFSYGDVLGAGRGWANSILFNSYTYDEFSAFFHNPSVFVLGVCNGCQMLANLRNIIPGATHWPLFMRNQSEQFEARLSMVRINPSPSIFFKGMENSTLPIVVSHGEGQVEVKQDLDENLIPLQYVDHYGKVTEQYPANPNGSRQGATAFTNTDGRFTIMMPHPERVFRTVQFSWRPKEWEDENSPWFKLFLNAREWVR